MALAAVTVAAIVATIIITMQERRRADKKLAEEQERHEQEVTQERAFADKRLQDERYLLQHREQLTEAYAVQIVVGEKRAADEPIGNTHVKRLAVFIANRGNYTITRVEVQFSPDGKSLMPPPQSSSHIGLHGVAGQAAGRMGRCRARDCNPGCTHIVGHRAAVRER